MKLINNFATKSSLTGRWVGISAENWRISGEIVTKNIKCCRQTGNRGGHFVFWDIEPEMLGHNPAEVPGHRPVILLTSRKYGITLGKYGITSRKYSITVRKCGIILGKYGITSGKYGITSRKYGITLGKYGITSRKYSITVRKYGII